MKQNLIFDIGAHEGHDSEYYLQKGFDVVAVEANPALVDNIIERNSKAIEEGRLKLVSAAIAQSEGTVELHLYEFNQHSSLYKFRPHIERHLVGKRKARTISVRSILPARLFEDFGVPYYLKADIEGAEILMLRAISCLQGMIPKYVSFEVNSDSPGESLEALEILAQRGYRRFKLFEQSVVPDIQLPCPQQEGKDVSYRFTHSHTGPFGEDTSGPWMDLKEIISAIQNIDWNTTMKCGWLPWFDVHAAR